MRCAAAVKPHYGPSDGDRGVWMMYDQSKQALTSLSKMLTFRRLTPAQWRLWKNAMLQWPQWYVVGRGVWTTERWRAVAGPFLTRGVAQRAAMRLANDGVSEGWVDPRQVYRTQIMSLSELMHVYKNRYYAIGAGSGRRTPAAFTGIVKCIVSKRFGLVDEIGHLVQSGTLYFAPPCEVCSSV